MTPTAPFQDGDARALRRFPLGTMGMKLPMTREVCIECGLVCTDLHVKVYLVGGVVARTFCLAHAQALAERQDRWARRQLAKLGRAD